MSSAVRSVFAPGGGSTTATWTVTSVLASLFLNATAILVCLPWLDIDLSKSLTAIKQQLTDLTGWNVGLYLSVVYVLSLVWGLVSGLSWQHSPRHLSFLNHLTPISPEPDVFHLALGQTFRTEENLAKRGKEDQQVPWLRVETKNGTVVGRLMSSNVRIHQEKPIEIYLAPAYRIENGTARRLGGVEGADFVGLYLRIKPDQATEVYSARADWTPNSSGARDD